MQERAAIVLGFQSNLFGAHRDVGAISPGRRNQGCWSPRVGDTGDQEGRACRGLQTGFPWDCGDRSLSSLTPWDPSGASDAPRRAMLGASHLQPPVPRPVRFIRVLGLRKSLTIATKRSNPSVSGF